MAHPGDLDLSAAVITGDHCAEQAVALRQAGLSGDIQALVGVIIGDRGLDGDVVPGLDPAVFERRCKGVILVQAVQHLIERDAVALHKEVRSAPIGERHLAPARALHRQGHGQVPLGAAQGHQTAAVDLHIQLFPVDQLDGGAELLRHANGAIVCRGGAVIADEVLLPQPGLPAPVRPGADLLIGEGLLGIKGAVHVPGEGVELQEEIAPVFGGLAEGVAGAQEKILRRLIGAVYRVQILPAVVVRLRVVLGLLGQTLVRLLGKGL